MKNTLAKFNEDAYLPSLHLNSRIALQVARKIAPCDMAFRLSTFLSDLDIDGIQLLGTDFGPSLEISYCITLTCK